MSTKNERNVAMEALEKEFSSASGIFVADNNRITVEKITKLRSDLRKTGVRFVVVKNTLAKAAATKSGKEKLASHFKGPTAVVFASKDGTAPAKILRDFQRENKDLLTVKGAYVDGSIFSGVDAMRLADLPSREVLLAQLLGCLKAPVGKLAGSLGGIMTKFVGTLNAVKDKKSAAE